MKSVSRCRHYPSRNIGPWHQLDLVLAQLLEVQPIGRLHGLRPCHATAWISLEGDLHAMVPKTSGATRRWINCSACARRGEMPGSVLVSSRASYEMVQKTAMCDVEILFAISAATSLAVEVAERCDLMLVGFSKPWRDMVFTNPTRIVEGIS